MDTYKTKPGDTWDVIAKDLYGSELLATQLMRANPEHLDYYSLPAGLVIKVPELSGDEADMMPPWRD